MCQVETREKPHRLTLTWEMDVRSGSKVFGTRLVVEPDKICQGVFMGLNIIRLRQSGAPKWSESEMM